MLNILKTRAFFLLHAKLTVCTRILGVFMINLTEGIEFDPGFTVHLSLISRDISNFYYNLDSLKFSQKKQHFKMYSAKLWRLIERNIGFYAGCILWAGVAKNHPEQLIMNNICYGGEYVEADNVEEVQFLREYLMQFKKDMKYYCGKDFDVPGMYLTVLDDYEEFLKVNEGFVKVSKAQDLKLPANVNMAGVADESLLLNKIEKVVETGDFAPMLEFYSKVK